MSYSVAAFGIIGFPLSHSFSKQYFTEKFAREHISAVFYNFPIASIEELPYVLQQHAELKGLAVTIPYKKAILPFLYQQQPAVQEIQAANCIKISEGKLFGFNTDITGFEHSFFSLWQPHHQKALILGTGGAALAVAYVLKKHSLPFQFVSRQATVNTITYANINKQLLEEYTIIINCTPLGTHPNIKTAPPLPYEFLTPEHYLFDLVYNPSTTAFLHYGKQHGAIIKNGYEMLLIQAEENWKIWNA